MQCGTCSTQKALRKAQEGSGGGCQRNSEDRQTRTMAKRPNGTQRRKRGQPSHPVAEQAPGTCQHRSVKDSAVAGQAPRFRRAHPATGNVETSTKFQDTHSQMRSRVESRKHDVLCRAPGGPAGSVAGSVPSSRRGAEGRPGRPRMARLWGTVWEQAEEGYRATALSALHKVRLYPEGFLGRDMTTSNLKF